jgi:hypothetical protein
MAEGISPLEYMLGILRDTNAAPDRRDWAAEKAAPYVHARLAATELKGADGGAIKVELVSFADHSTPQ